MLDDDLTPIPADKVRIRLTNTLARLPNVKLERGKSYTFVFTGRAAKYDLVKIENAAVPDTQ